MALPKPKHLAPEYGSQFSDPSVASAYCFRPPYPDEVYVFLEELIADTPRIVLELGCGLGEITRRLAARAKRVDAVNPSHAMLAIARTLPGGCPVKKCKRVYSPDFIALRQIASCRLVIFKVG